MMIIWSIVIDAWSERVNELLFQAFTFLHRNHLEMDVKHFKMSPALFCVKFCGAVFFFALHIASSCAENCGCPSTAKDASVASFLSL